MSAGVSFRAFVLVAITSAATSIGIWMLAERMTANEPAALRIDQASEFTELAQRITALESGVRGLRELIERNASQSAIDAATTSTRVPQGRSAAADETLAVQLHDLQAAIAALDERLSASLTGTREALASDLKSSIAEAMLALGPRAEPLPDTLPDRQLDLARFQALRGLELEETTAPHLLWTYERVGQEYGRPTEVYPSPGGVGIKYRYELPDGTGFTFWFVDGKVVRAFW